LAFRIVADGKEPGSVRATPALDHGLGELRRVVDRLETLPLRPASARQALAWLGDDPAAEQAGEPLRIPALTETDPAWALARSRSGSRPVDALAVLADHRWWPASTSTGSVAEALARLWRQSAAVAFAARRLAREAGLDDPEAVARAGMLHGLGLWALAAVAPDRLVEWFATPGTVDRRALERRWLGAEASDLGRDLAVRWGCEPLVVDAAWLHGDLHGDLNGCSADPHRLALIQQAVALARRTPWSPDAEDFRDVGPGDPRVKILTAEVQSRCGGPFVDLDASPREERLTQENARLRRDLARLRLDQDQRERFIRAVAESSPTESPEDWAERASLAFRGEPGIGAVRVEWLGGKARDSTTAGASRSAALRLGDPSRPCATVHLRHLADAPVDPQPPTTLDAWDAWARAVQERSRLGKLLDEAVSAHRGRVDREESTRRRAMLEALAEFAAGAGHELNNPLAVILGRAQLLLARQDDPEAVRSLRAIIAQAQRAHRILRDLMYVARPPEPRPRPCQPEEIVRACLRDLQDEADARGIRIVSEAREPGPKVWVDPDPLRQLADILGRNALEATPSGGSIQFTTGGDDRSLRWAVHDSGRGIGASEGQHLFDPFFCGRQAGRGLGLGLPRAARIVAEAGGELRWKSVPGYGTTFQVSMPVAEVPPASPDEMPGSSNAHRALPVR
jgi:signal transduction histidine kinase